MVSRRKALMTVGAAVTITGCTNTSTPSESRAPNETEASNGSENNKSGSDGTSSEPQATIEITAVEVPESIVKGSDFDIVTTISTDTSVTLTLEAFDANDESIAEQSTQINQTGEQSITLSTSVSRQAALGEGSVRVRATGGSVTRESTSQITITADWQVAFTDAKENVEEFLAEFTAVSSVDEPTILDTNVSADYTNEGRSLLTDAEDLAFDALEGVPDSNNSFRNKAQRLRSEIGVARDMSTLQEQLSDIFSEAQGQLDSDSYSRPNNDRVSETESQRSEFSATVSDLNPVVGSRYEAKSEQFESELESMDSVFSGIRELATAQNALDRENYDTAFSSAQSAKSTFETVVEEINSPESYPPTDRVDQTFVELVEELESTANDMQLSAAAEQQSE